MLASDSGWSLRPITLSLVLRPSSLYAGAFLGFESEGPQVDEDCCCELAGYCLAVAGGCIPG